MRWWDGTTWSDYHAAGANVRRALPADVSPNTPWIWLAVLAPLLAFTSIFLVDYRAMFVESFSHPGMLVSPFPPGYFAALAVSWSIAALVVVFSYFDWKSLKAKGVDRPFHWAWAFFIGYPVYIIGRSVIVHSVSKRGLGPIWVYIAVFVAEIAMVVILMAWIFQTMFEYAGQYPSYS
jgi:hypothetical protein